MEWREKVPVKPYSQFDSIQTILANIHGIDDLPRFLNPTESELHSPYLLTNILQVRKEIVFAIENNLSISIHVDIDTDGATSGTLMFNHIKMYTDNVRYFHAQRSEGHSIDISENDIPIGTELLIIIDSSSNSVDACRRIRDRGINIIVLDHHEVDVENPYCLLLNPQQPCDNYPNKSISAVVIVWKLIQTLDDYFGTNYADYYYDVVAIGLQGDLMDMMIHENRYIVQRGINSINNRGIKSLLEVSKKDTYQITCSDIGYFLSPNINAACRMDRIEVVLELLVEQDYEKSILLAKEVLAMNEERKKIQSKFYAKLSPLINENDKCSIIIDSEIGAGFKGLIAGDFANKFHKPVLVMSEKDGVYFGSYRSYNNYDLKTFLNGIDEIIFAAGHKPAGGTRFDVKDLNIIKTNFNDHFQQEDMDQYLEYVYELNLKDLNQYFIKDVESFYSISGKNFPVGIFKINDILVTDRKVMGKGNNTIKLSTYPASKTFIRGKEYVKKLSSVASIMKFRTDEGFITDEIIGETISILGTLNINEYKDRYGKFTVTNQIFLDQYQVV